MKKLITIVIMAVCSLVAAAQEQSEKKLILKNGTTLTGIVEVQTDGSYQLKTDSGDILFLAPSEVEGVVDNTANVNKEIDTNHGNEIYSPVVKVYRKGGNLRFKNTGEIMMQDDFFDYALWNKYKKARSIRKWGGALTLSAGPLIAIGIYELDAYEYAGNLDHLTGIFGTIIGATALVVGPLLFLKGTHNINEVATVYNRHSGYALDFGIQQHGVGFALNF